LLGPVDYIILKVHVTCYNYIENIFTFLPRTCSINAKWRVIHPPLFAHDQPRNLRVTRFIRRVWVNIQHGQNSMSRGHQRFRKNGYAKLLKKNDPGYIQRLLVSIFNGEKVPEVKYSTLKMNPGSIFNPVQNTSLHRQWWRPHNSWAGRKTVNL
jgi:hypothetical protein